MYDNLHLEIRKIAEENLPKGVEIVETPNSFIFRWGDEFIKNISRDWEMVPVTKFSRSSSFDKCCVISDARGHESISFYRSKFFKGKQIDLMELHRDDDFPALFRPDQMVWYSGGEVSRKNNFPAYITPHEVIWALDGKWHREDGPAKINTIFGKSWFLNHKKFLP